MPWWPTQGSPTEVKFQHFTLYDERTTMWHEWSKMCHAAQLHCLAKARSIVFWNLSYLWKLVWTLAFWQELWCQCLKTGESIIFWCFSSIIFWCFLCVTMFVTLPFYKTPIGLTESLLICHWKLSTYVVKSYYTFLDKGCLYIFAFHAKAHTRTVQS